MGAEAWSQEDISAQAAAVAGLTIGPVTEARIRDSFARSPLITAKACADLLTMDVKTLRGMTLRGLISSVLTGAKGTTRQYTEADVRAFFAGPRAPVRPQEAEEKCPSTNQKDRRISTSTSSTKVVGFTEALAKRRGGKPKR